jgi:hypothetical protein
MRAYSLDLRVRVFADYDAGQTFAQLARKYSVSAEWVRQIVRRRERTGEVAGTRRANRGRRSPPGAPPRLSFADEQTRNSSPQVIAYEQFADISRLLMA